MNNDRRKVIKALYTQVEFVKGAHAAAKTAYDHFIELSEQLASDISSIKDEEQEYIDNLPENLQSSEKAQIANDAVNCLEEAEGLCQDIDLSEEFDWDDVISKLDEATN
jgi:hypothetical protein